jgi:predicted RNA-binding protein YlxR (DUF448 family)
MKKEEMLRFIEEGNGKEKIDLKKEVPGRGFYLCTDVGCFNVARKKKRWAGDLESAERFLAISSGAAGGSVRERMRVKEEKEWRK